MSSTNYTFSDLLNAIESGNITQAETILQYLYQNGSISKNNYNYAEALINTMKSLGLEGEQIMNTINTIVSTFEQQYQNSIISGNTSNINNLAMSITAISKFFPQYETLIPPIARKLANKITAMFGHQNTNNTPSLPSALSVQQQTSAQSQTFGLQQAQSKISSNASKLANKISTTPAYQIISNNVANKISTTPAYQIISNTPSLPSALSGQQQTSAQSQTSQEQQTQRPLLLM